MIHRLRWSLVISVASLASCGPVQSSAQLKNLPGEDPSAAAILGQGVNNVDGTVKGHCVDLGRIVTQSGQATGSTAEYRVLEISSEQSLRENFNISAAASIKGAIYGGSGRVNFSSSVNKNASSRYLLVHAKVSNQLELASAFSYKDEAASLLVRGDQKGFVERCGNEFVYGRRTGGEFYALFEYEFSSSEEEKRFSSAISASGTGWKASASVNQEMAKFNMAARVHVKMFRLGGSGELPDVNNLQDYGRKFPEIVAAISGSPVTLELITKDYSGVAPLDLVMNPALIERQRYAIHSIAEARDKANETLASIRYIRRNSDKFEPFIPADFDRAEQALIRFVNAQNDAAVACFSDIWNHCQVPDLLMPLVDLPKRHWDSSNRCPRAYAWSEEEQACCRLEWQVVCALEASDGSCLAHERRQLKSCL